MSQLAGEDKDVLQSNVEAPSSLEENVESSNVNNTTLDCHTTIYFYF